MLKAMKRIVLIAAAMIMLATWALPAYAVSPQDPGAFGYRYLKELGLVYCDNFYNGPPAGAPAKGILQKQVYWCYADRYGGHWVAVAANV